MGWGANACLTLLAMYSTVEEEDELQPCFASHSPILGGENGRAEIICKIQNISSSMYRYIV